MNDQSNTPAGWYPAPHANNEMRYWDGAQWTNWTPESAAAAQAAPAEAQSAAGADASQPASLATATLVAEGPAAAPTKKKGLRWWAWVLIALGAIIVLAGIIGAINGAGDDGARPASVSREEEPAVVEEPEEELVEVPDLVGLTVTEAAAALSAIGFTLDVSENPDWLVTEQSLTGEVTEDDLASLVLTSEPDWTLAQKNAIGQAESYLDNMAFSRTGLIGQLEYEGYSTADATFAADNVGADWNAEAAEQAESYLNSMSFSREGLYDQLEYEGYTPEQIEFGLKAVGY